MSLEVVPARSVSCVLDVGCGAGQELLPYASGACCVGVDLSPEVGIVGRKLFREMNAGERVAFARATAEALPFRTDSFDAVICRLALPYTDNARALAEIARVLKSDGTFLLKIHHARYYLRKFWRGLVGFDLMSTVHAARVIAAGLVYHTTGKQVRVRLLSPETFQTEWLLKRELARLGLAIAQELPDSNPFTPVFLIRTSGNQVRNDRL